MAETAHAASPAQAAPAIAAARDTRPVPALLALPLRGAGALTYALTVNGQPGEAALSFRIEDGRYDLLLERRAGDRDLPSWHSEGRVGPQGLMPERHRVRRQGRERELIVFDRDADTPRLLVGARAYALSAGMQDRLSWWLQLSALMAAEPDPHLGLRLRIPVAARTARSTGISRSPAGRAIAGCCAASGRPRRGVRRWHGRPGWTGSGRSCRSS